MTPPIDHRLPHLLVGFGLALATVAAMGAVRNHVLRRRLFFSVVAWVLFLAMHFVMNLPSLIKYGKELQAVEILLFALAAITAGVALAFNSWIKENVERAPAIVQDTVTFTLFGVVLALMFRENATALAGGAAAGIVLGFALQETLGNAFLGIGIQIEKPFRVGHWISVASYEGLVTEVTWRATRIRTKTGNLVIVPNNMMAREAITNYSEPTLPTRIMVDVGAGYQFPPSQVTEAIFAALKQSQRVLRIPEPEVLLLDFAASSITYRTRFWIDDYFLDEEIKNEVRRGIWYEFSRRNIEIPWPIQIEYQRYDKPVDVPALRARFTKTIAAVPVLATLSPDIHRALADAAEERLYGNGETVVREGDSGGSMFLVNRGRVVVSVGENADSAAAGKEVAVIEAGGFFGEMSLLTGEPRTATVRARGDCTVLEISATAFREYVRNHPEVIDHLAEAAQSRRRTLDERRKTVTDVEAEGSESLVQIMRNFFGLSAAVQPRTPERFPKNDDNT
jgi:small-conductance mechanosensitive channel/CRP-like cAMP-binding protein